MKEKLAIEGGAPVRKQVLRYGSQSIDLEEREEVLKVLESDWLTTGPKVSEFEEEFARSVGMPHAVAFSSGTAALHGMMATLGIGPGDEVIVPCMTFAATANSVVFQGGTPVFCDVDDERHLIDPDVVAAKITSATKAVIAVDFAGHPCAYAELNSLCQERGIPLLADSCHSLGGSYQGSPSGSQTRMSTFSFHPVKPITTAEGGMVACRSKDDATALRRFRNHGIETEFRDRESKGTWHYEMTSLGYNYRLTDLQCALGIIQLRKLPEFVKKRHQLAKRYEEALKSMDYLRFLPDAQEIENGRHLFVIRLRPECWKASRGEVFEALRAEGVGVNVHYIPVHFHPFYRERFATKEGDCPVGERAYEESLSLPLHTRMSLNDVDDVIYALQKVHARYGQ